MHITELAKTLQAEIHNPHQVNLDLTVEKISPLHLAQKGAISFLSQSKFLAQAQNTTASVLLIKQPIETVHPVVQLLHPHPYLAMAKAAQLFYQVHYSFTGISEQAFIHPTAQIAKDATVYPFAYVGKDARIGSKTTLFPYVYIGDNCIVGDECVLHPTVTLMHETVLGNRIIIHAGSVLGADGFGFVPTKDGQVKIPQVGIVAIEDDVEIGALCTIDRAALDKTILRRGTKLDSHVHVGHNVEIGEHSLLCAQVGVAGSTKLGKRFIAAGQSGISQGLHVADHVVIGPRTAILQDIDQPGEYLGIPAIPSGDWKRQAIASKRLPEFAKKIAMLEKEVSALKAVLVKQSSHHAPLEP